MISVGSLPSQPRDFTLQLAALSASRAGEWFAPTVKAASVTSRIINQRQRRVCSLYRLETVVAGERHHLWAKQYRDWRRGRRGENDNSAEPLRLFPPPDHADKARFEFAALSQIHGHFSTLSDRRFSAVRPLAVLAPEQTILLAEFAGCSLAKLLNWRARPTGKVGRQRLIQVLRHTGGWLRQYHSLGPLPHTRARSTTRLEFIESLRRSSDYLVAALGRAELFEQAINCGALAAAAELPQDLPLALSHSDFAPRNVLVAAGNEVAAIDTLGRWQAPIYEDLGHFLVALRTGSWCSRGMRSSAAFREIETAFVEGYFGSTAPPWPAVRLFELQSLLYHWVAVAQGADNSRGLRRLVKRCRLAVINQFFANYLASVIRRLNP